MTSGVAGGERRLGRAGPQKSSAAPARIASEVSAAAITAVGKTKSTGPAAMLARGISGTAAEAGS